MFRLMPTDSRCRRDAEAWATENLGLSGGKKTERGGRSFREDSHAHHYINIHPHLRDELCARIDGLLESISIHVPT